MRAAPGRLFQKGEHCADSVGRGQSAREIEIEVVHARAVEAEPASFEGATEPSRAKRGRRLRKSDVGGDLDEVAVNEAHRRSGAVYLIMAASTLPSQRSPRSE
jgi:hypothetical protein